MTTTLAELLAVSARAAAFSGWSFDQASVSYPEGRDPWDYATMAAELLGPLKAAVDLGTGGGELFGEILGAPGFTGRAFATEQWHVNAPSRGNASVRSASPSYALTRFACRSGTVRSTWFSVATKRSTPPK